MYREDQGREDYIEKVKKTSYAAGRREGETVSYTHLHNQSAGDPAGDNAVDGILPFSVVHFGVTHHFLCQMFW